MFEWTITSGSAEEIKKVEEIRAINPPIVLIPEEIPPTVNQPIVANINVEPDINIVGGNVYKIYLKLAFLINYKLTNKKTILHFLLNS